MGVFVLQNESGLQTVCYAMPLARDKLLMEPVHVLFFCYRGLETSTGNIE